MVTPAMYALCITVLCVGLTQCITVTPTPLASEEVLVHTLAGATAAHVRSNATAGHAAEETTTSASATAVDRSDGRNASGMSEQEQRMTLRCPSHNQEQYIATHWHMCDSSGRVGLYRIANGTVTPYATLNRERVAAYKAGSDGALSVSPEKCSEDRAYICDRWANVGFRNECWMFLVRNCTARMSTAGTYCTCSLPPRTNAASGAVSSSVLQQGNTLLWFGIAVLTIVYV